MEPKQQAKKLERYKNKIGLAQAISNVSNKIWALIDEVFEVTVMYNMVQQLTLRLFHTESHVEFVLTLIYTKCDAIERIELWDSLYAMARDMEAPWLVGGDFNVIWDEEEKFGGLPVSLNEIDDFRHCINTCNLFDLGFKGIEVQHLSKTGSDHSPMYLKCDIETPPIKKPFKFLNFWVEHVTFKDVVKENWSANFSANPYILFNHKLKKLKKALSLWSTSTFGDILQKIASMEEVVMVHEAEFEANPTGMNKERLQKVQAELIKCLALEEKYWQQKAGMTWFKEGDRNTNGGTWIEEEQEIAQEAIKFYEEQFTEASTPSSFDIVEHIPNLINIEQNAELIKQPTKEEVKVAVLGLNGDSAGGPDGMTGKFYHSCWDIIGDDMYDMVRALFNGHELPKCVTHTNLVLLPKKKEVTTFSDLRPISLSNFSNKVISRVVHERLVKFLPSLISEEQSGFAKGRNIVENILLTQEIVTDIRLRTNVGPNVILKLDMTKAYDRLSWLFLTKVLRKMGFTERLIGIVFELVSNNWVIYQVSSNLQALVKVRKPGMDMVPYKWQDLLAMMENFTPKLKVQKGLKKNGMDRHFHVVMESMRFSSKWEHGKHDGNFKFWTEIDANSFGVCTSMLGNFEYWQVYNCLMLEDEGNSRTSKTSGTNFRMRFGNIRQTKCSTKDESSCSEEYYKHMGSTTSMVENRVRGKAKQICATF
uniref:Reverse transcriptase domain-containing protein n=1 Tax=Nicotiana tabacum TaxID=4097 RepID=A0A1S4DEX8_TOBAC|nr:PREDICTED: uncharacterized protein LOC107829005 [Nicotiana tabacum]